MKPTVPAFMRVAGAIICMLSIFVSSMTVSGGFEHNVSYSSESFFDVMRWELSNPITLAGLVFLGGAFLCLFFERSRYLLIAGLVALFFVTFLMWPYLDSGAKPEVGSLVSIFGTTLCFCAPIVRMSLERPDMID